MKEPSGRPSFSEPQPVSSPLFFHNQSLTVLVVTVVVVTVAVVVVVVVVVVVESSS